MPVTLVGTKVKDRVNFMAVGWISRVNYIPAMIGIGIYKTHYTSVGIKQNKTFSVCIPSKDLVKETDYCGIVSGKKHDKSKVFDVFYGKTKTAPMIKECPINIECKLYKTVSLPDNNLFIGKVVGVYTEKKYLSQGEFDLNKIKPFLLTMPDNNYSLIGKKIADAYKIGKKLINK
jgi:flavin reductase (DIM6/NTAB) family NADH-FMN oxidoreductase RutF